MTNYIIWMFVADFGVALFWWFKGHTVQLVCSLYSIDFDLGKAVFPEDIFVNICHDALTIKLVEI